jgi:hypothetical protein
MIVVMMMVMWQHPCLFYQSFHTSSQLRKHIPDNSLFILCTWAPTIYFEILIILLSDLSVADQLKKDLTDDLYKSKLQLMTYDMMTCKYWLI